MKNTHSLSLGHNGFSGKNIMVVEDESVNQKVMNILLQKFGCNVVICSTGAEAISYIKSSDNVDLIFMDCQMPEMDGFQTVEKIRRYEAATGKTAVAIVALTGDALPETRDKCFESGMNAFLGKPIQKKAIENVLHEYLKIA